MVYVAQPMSYLTSANGDYLSSERMFRTMSEQDRLHLAQSVHREMAGVNLTQGQNKRPGLRYSWTTTTPQRREYNYPTVLANSSSLAGNTLCKLYAT